MTNQEMQEPISKKFKTYILDVIQRIPDEQITEKIYIDCKNIFDSIQKIDNILIGGAVGDSLTCKICGGHYKKRTRASHEKSKRHIIEDAKIHHMYDYKNKEILSPKDLIQISTYKIETK